MIWNNEIFTIDELKTLEKKSRHILYKNKEKLTDVLRYNSWWVIVPFVFEKKLREMLKSRREWIEFNSIFIWIDDDNLLNWFKSKKWWVFGNWKKRFAEIETSGNTYKHTATQWFWLYEYWKLSLNNLDIDILQYINDNIVNLLHDRSEQITDDIPPFEKNEEFRKNEKIAEHNLIDNCNSLSNEEKEYLKNILNYKKNSRFKTYEHMYSVLDAINMKEKKENYNEVLSVIYEILKLNLPRFMWTLELDNGNIVDMLSLIWIRSFFVDNLKKIDELFVFVKENKEELFNEYRFKDNNYCKSDLEWNFEELKRPREFIKSKINLLEKENQLAK